MGKSNSLWDNVKIEHVEEAIKNYVPKVQKGKTKYFLFVDNEEYPARQIRRLAYELANGGACTSEEIHGKGGKNAKAFFEGIEGFKERGYLCININEIKQIEVIKESDELEPLLKEISKDAIRYYLKKQKSEVTTKQVISNRYDRDKVLSFFVKELANGICQLCEREAPFIDKNGRAYLETHHIVPLSRNGKDDIDNTVALCPNCHRKMHSLGLEEDISKLTKIVKSRKL